MNLSDEDIDLIAEKAAEKALEKVYLEVGKTVVKKIFWIFGVVTIVILTWLSGTGKISL